MYDGSKTFSVGGMETAGRAAAGLPCAASGAEKIRVSATVKKRGVFMEMRE